MKFYFSSKTIEKMSNLVTRSTLLALDVGNSIFLSLCCYVLNPKRRRRTPFIDPQEIYVTNLAAAELFANIFLIARDIINIFRLTSKDFDVPFWSMNMAYVTGIFYICILARFYVTVDRLCHILLHLKYSNHWNIRKTKILLSITWIGNGVISVGMSLLMYFEYEYVKREAKISKAFAVYVRTVIYLIFCVFSFVAYGIMFMSYARPKRSRRRKGILTRQSSLFKNFITSRFTISLWLVSNYLLLTVIPSLTRSFYYISGAKVPYALTFCYLISTRLSYTIDGIIYTFIPKRNRSFLWKKLSCRKHRHKKETSDTSETSL